MEHHSASMDCSEDDLDELFRGYCIEFGEAESGMQALNERLGVADTRVRWIKRMTRKEFERFLSSPPRDKEERKRSITSWRETAQAVREAG